MSKEGKQIVDLSDLKADLRRLGAGRSIVFVPMKDIFQDGELDDLIKSLGYEDPTTAGADTEPDTIRADELQAEWGTELGQLWKCGPHRLIIGDCTDAIVDRVLDDVSLGDDGDE